MASRTTADLSGTPELPGTSMRRCSCAIASRSLSVSQNVARRTTSPPRVVRVSLLADTRGTSGVPGKSDVSAVEGPFGMSRSSGISGVPDVSGMSDTPDMPLVVLASSASASTKWPRLFRRRTDGISSNCPGSGRRATRQHLLGCGAVVLRAARGRIVRRDR
jgi:hypothetical protein